jgi:hypothetical protein
MPLSNRVGAAGPVRGVSPSETCIGLRTAISLGALGDLKSLLDEAWGQPPPVAWSLLKILIFELALLFSSVIPWKDSRTGLVEGFENGADGRYSPSHLYVDPTNQNPPQCSRVSQRHRSRQAIPCLFIHSLLATVECVGYSRALWSVLEILSH